MRKALASWQALQGIDLLTISKSLGHADIATTAKAYPHLSGNTIKAGVQKATDALQHGAGVEIGTSVSGVQLKMFMTLIKVVLVSSNQGEYIVKPTPHGLPKLSENEHATIKIAERTGFNAAK